MKFAPKNLQVVKRYPDGTVSILIKCEVDIIEAMRNEINILGVTLQPSSKDLASTSQAQTRLSPERAIQNILFDTSESERKKESRINSVVARSFIDITAYIDNSIAKILTVSGKKAALEALGTENVVLLESPMKGKQTASRVPILQTPSSVSNVSQKRIDTSIKQLMSDLILKDGKSPMSILRPSITYATTEKSLAGTTSNFPKLTGRSADLYNTIIGGPISDPESANDTTSDTSETDPIPVVKKQQKEKIEVYTVIHLTQDKLNKLGTNPIVKISAFGDPDADEIDNVGCNVDVLNKLTNGLNGNDPLIENPGGTGLSGGKPSIEEISDSILDLSPGAGSGVLNNNPPTTGGGTTGGGGTGRTGGGGLDIEYFVDPFDTNQPYDESGWGGGGSFGRGSFGNS
ncbi:MAG: hypothetical protein ACW96N_05305, partial [Candidatus Thorarchaeota archaeon]